MIRHHKMKLNLATKFVHKTASDRAKETFTNFLLKSSQIMMFKADIDNFISVINEMSRRLRKKA